MTATYPTDTFTACQNGLSSRVLVLNRSYIPIQITSLKRALCLIYQDLARVIDKEFSLFDFRSWSELTVEAHHESIGLINSAIRIPRVILLSAYDRFPKRHVRFSRNNIYLRDHNRCQYCGRHFRRQDLNLDHVVPRCRGGKTNWENVVTSCIVCNTKKGMRSPADVGFKLIRPPERPRWSPIMDIAFSELRYEEWKPFINIVDFSYWNLELIQE